MKVLVTGHLGYIGAELVPMLIAAGHDVVGLDTDYFHGRDFGSKPVAVPAIRMDIRDITQRHLAGFEAVVHLAALSNDPVSELNPQLTYDINLGASLTLARLAKAAGVERFVFSSSCSLYGSGSDGAVAEDAHMTAVTPYGESKIRAEEAIRPLADDRFCPTFLRNATAYGISRRLRTDVVVNNLVGHAVTSGRVLLTSNGEAWRPLVHVRDIAHAMVVVLRSPPDAVHNEVFNVGRTNENHQIRDVAKMVADIVPNCELTFADEGGADIRNYVVDFTKIETSLPGYSPQWTLATGIAEIYAAYVDEGLSADRFGGSDFVRLRALRELLDSEALDHDLRWKE
ncbi:NAD-dependent epimerase/dehydratase family protein [Gordonia sp. ABKF26]|uniref:NAD-dependent epimerase/dehydratase family protein n=1 Tax=Gordonia sp. ABKF26 TaxID=3238687 RepID=UPI0034E3B17B